MVRRTRSADPVSGAPARLGKLTQQVVQDLGVAIVVGRCSPDKPFPIEADLCEEFGVSRSIVREAIKVLNAKGMVASRPHHGTFVLPASNWNLFDPDVLDWILKGRFSLPLLVEFTHIRLGLEPRAAALAAELAAPAQQKAIRAGFERMCAAEAGQDETLAADIAFHLAILDASNNRFMTGLKPMVNAALNFSIRYTDDLQRDTSAKLKRHKALCDAILARDARKAEAAAHKLLQEVLDLMTSTKRAKAHARRLQSPAPFRPPDAAVSLGETSL